MIRRVDAGGVVDGVGVDLSAAQVVFDARLLGESEVGAFPDDANAQLAGADAHRVIRAIARGRMLLMRRLDIRADAAEPEKIGADAQNRLHQIGRCDALGRKIEQLLNFVRNLERLLRSVVDRTALRQKTRVVSIPIEALVEQALAFRKRKAWIGIRIDENVRVVEGRDEMDVRREQHRVAEDIARHVADANDREILILDVHPELAEVPLDRLPPALRGDAHRLVVVARAAA